MKSDDFQIDTHETSTARRAVEVVALYGDTPQKVQHFRSTRGGRIRALTATLLAAGLLLAVGGAVAFGTQVWAVKKQEAQRARVMEFVKERGLPEKFVPRVKTDRTVEIAGAAAFASGLFLLLLGFFRARDERRVPSFTIGEDPRCSYSTPTDALPSARFPLVQAEGDGYVMSFTSRMEGRVAVPGQDDQELIDLARCGAARPSGTHGVFRYRLPRGARCRLEMDANTFLVSSVPAGEEPEREDAAAVVAAQARKPIAWSTAGVGLVMLAFLMLMQLKPAGAEAMEADSLSRSEHRRFRGLIQQARKDRAEETKRAEPKTKPRPQPVASRNGKPQRNAAAYDERRKPGQGKDRGASDRGRGQGEGQGYQGGMTTVLKNMSGRMADMMATNMAAEQQMEDSLDALRGYREGTDGFLDIGPGRRAGHVRGYVSSGPWSLKKGGNSPFDGDREWFNDNGPFKPRVPDHHAKDPVVFRPGRPDIPEGIDGATIRRYVRMRNGSIKYCYVSKALAANQDARGTVTVWFMITKLGKVLGVRIASSTLGHGPTEQCIASVIRSIRFPRTGGRTAVVKYPFNFRPAGRR